MAGIIVKPRSRIFHGHEWVYGTEIKKIFGSPNPGDVISIKDFKDRFLGTAIYNPNSQIVARRFSRRKEQLTKDFFLRRIQRAKDLRDKFNFKNNIYRLIWSESDGLPGVIIDRYEDYFVLQTLTLAMDLNKEVIVNSIKEIFNNVTIIERNDSISRKSEGLNIIKSTLSGKWNGKFDVNINGVIQEVDLMEGQKTGIYLDQLDNYFKVSKFCKDKRVLDCFCNQGGFGLHALKSGAYEVDSVDSSSKAIKVANNNFIKNEFPKSSFNVFESNVFDFLKEKDKSEDKYDVIIIDPPSFSKNKKSLSGALRGYKEIHLRAMKLLNPNGILSSYSCSHHVNDQIFINVISESSIDAKKTFRIFDKHIQRKDHPIILTIPETYYLKGYSMEMSGSF